MPDQTGHTRVSTNLISLISLIKLIESSSSGTKYSVVNVMGILNEVALSSALRLLKHFTLSWRAGMSFWRCFRTATTIFMPTTQSHDRDPIGRLKAAIHSAIAVCNRDRLSSGFVLARKLITVSSILTQAVFIIPSAIALPSVAFSLCWNPWD